MANGLVRINLIEPKLDIIIYCNPSELKVFMHTVEALQSINERLIYQYQYGSDYKPIVVSIRAQ